MGFPPHPWEASSTIYGCHTWHDCLRHFFRSFFLFIFIPGPFLEKNVSWNSKGRFNRSKNIPFFASEFWCFLLVFSLPVVGGLFLCLFAWVVEFKESIFWIQILMCLNCIIFNILKFFYVCYLNFNYRSYRNCSID